MTADGPEDLRMDVKMDKQLYRYKIRLNSTADVIAFSRTASRCPHDISLVNGHHRLNAKSYLGVALAKIAWDSVFLEADYDCYFDFEKFIV